MKKVLLDADVILDFFFDRQPFSKDISFIFSLCEQGKLMGYVTPVIISNIYYLLRKTASHKKVLEKITLLLSITDVLLMDKDVVIRAINSEFKDFEDALQNFAAVKDGDIDLIITRNVKDFKKSEIGVLTPESYIKSEIANR